MWARSIFTAFVFSVIATRAGAQTVPASPARARSRLALGRAARTTEPFRQPQPPLHRRPLPLRHSRRPQFPAPRRVSTRSSPRRLV